MRALVAAQTSFIIFSLGSPGFARALESCNKTFYIYEFLSRLRHVTIGNRARSLNLVPLEYPRSLQIPIMGL